MLLQLVNMVLKDACLGGSKQWRGEKGKGQHCEGQSSAGGRRASGLPQPLRAQLHSHVKKTYKQCTTCNHPPGLLCNGVYSQSAAEPPAAETNTSLATQLWLKSSPAELFQAHRLGYLYTAQTQAALHHLLDSTNAPQATPPGLASHYSHPPPFLADPPADPVLQIQSHACQADAVLAVPAVPAEPAAPAVPAAPGERCLIQVNLACENSRHLQRRCSGECQEGVRGSDTCCRRQS